MSSRKHKSSSRRELREHQEDVISSDWTDWIWDADYQAYKRWRRDSQGETVWDWENTGNAEASSQELGTIPKSDGGVLGITSSLQNTTLGAPQEAHYSGKGKGVSTASDFGSSPPHNYASDQPTRNEGSRPGRRSRPQIASTNLERKLRVGKSKDFKFGRIFKILWSEPRGNGGGAGNTEGSDVTENAIVSKGGPFVKVRPFLIIREDKGHCICLPILTYGGQGTLKKGAHPEHHAVIYSSSRKPDLRPGEDKEKKLKKSIRVEITDQSHKLDEASRLNYAKLYTVEHNMPVYFIGYVVKKYEQQVVTDFNLTHRPIPNRPDYGIESSDENTTRFANNYDAIYPIDEQDMPSSSAAQGRTRDAGPVFRDGYPSETEVINPNYITTRRTSHGSQYQGDYAIPRQEHPVQGYPQEEAALQIPEWDQAQDQVYNYRAGEGSSEQQYDPGYHGRQ